MSTKAQTVREERAEAVTTRSLQRSAVYRVLSQALSYPTQDGVAGLLQADLPEAIEAMRGSNSSLATALDALGNVARSLDAPELQREHRRVLSHTISMDCPPCETFYTAPHIFQETQDLSDIGGFLRAFGLQLAERERPDHITVELEFMHFLTYKEAHATFHHGPAAARICKNAQRKFMRDHLGRWGSQFAQRLAQKSGGGFYGRVASLLEEFLRVEMGHLRVQPDIVFRDQEWRMVEPAESGCCPLAPEDGKPPCV